MHFLLRPVLLLLFVLSVNLMCAQKIRYNTQACTLSVTDKSKIQAVVEFEAAFFADVFGPKKLPTVFINVYGEKKLYNKKDPPPNSQGFYRPGSKTIYVLYSSEYLFTCYHESSHALFDVFAKNRPTWINEGLATYFEYAKVDTAGQVTIFAPKSRLREMRSLTQSDELHISPLLGRKHFWFHKWREHRNYTLSWGIVNYLMTLHRETFGTVLYRIGTGTDSGKAINDEYSGGIAQLEKDLVAYYK
jgi:hypothetical protein